MKWPTELIKEIMMGDPERTVEGDSWKYGSNDALQLGGGRFGSGVAASLHHCWCGCVKAFAHGLSLLANRGSESMD